MIQTSAPRLALSLLLLLTILVAPLSRLYAQGPDLPMPGDVVTGSDPEPTGEPSSNAMPGSVPTPAVAVPGSASLR